MSRSFLIQVTVCEDGDQEVISDFDIHPDVVSGLEAGNHVDLEIADFYNIHKPQMMEALSDLQDWLINNPTEVCHNESDSPVGYKEPE